MTRQDRKTGEVFRWLRLQHLGANPAPLMATTALALTLAAMPAPAQTRWIAGDGNWNTAGNWSPAVVPNGGADVVIDRPGVITVTHSIGAHTIGRLTSEESLVLSGGSLAINGVSSLAGNFTLSGGALVGTGDLTIGGTTILQGSASLPALAGSGRLITNGMVEFGGGVTLRDQRVLDLRADGAWTGGEMALLGDARIVNAAGSTFKDSGGGSIVGSDRAQFENAGVYRKQDGGTTTFEVPFINQATGTIELINADLDLASGGSSIAGKLRIAAGRSLMFGGTGNTMRGIDGLNAEGSIVVTGTTSLTFKGSNQFDGTLVVRNSVVVVDTGLVLGSLDLRGQFENSGVVIVNGEATVQSRSRVSRVGTTIIQGELRSAGGFDLEISGGQQIELRGGGTLSGGQVQLDGRLTAQGGAVINAAGSVLSINGVSVSARRRSSFMGITNHGRLRTTGDNLIGTRFVGAEDGTIEIASGNLIFTSDETLIRGKLESGTLGRLVLAGAGPAALDGRLVVNGLQGAVDDAGTTGARGVVEIRGATRLVGDNDLGNSLEITGGSTVIEDSLRTRNARLTGGSTTVTGAWKNAFSMSLEGEAVLKVDGLGTLETGSFNQRGGELAGSGNILVTGPLNIEAASAPAVMTGRSAVVVDGQLGIHGDLQVDGGKTIFARDSALWTRGTIDLHPFAQTGFDPAGGKIVNAPGSLFVVEGTASMIASKGAGDALFENAGTFRRQGAGTTTIEAPFLNAASGRVEVRGGTLRLHDAQNVAGLKLGGGTWAVSGDSLLEFIEFFPILENAATLVLDGPGAMVRSGQRFATSALGEFLADNSGVIELRNGAIHGGFAALRNAGTIKLDGGILAPRVLNNAAGAVIVGTGEVRVRVENAGTIRASGGPLLLAQGVGGANGTLQIDAGAKLVLGGTATNETGRLRHLGTALDLGANALRVTKDYENIKFGVGNDFDPLANVSGAKGITSVGATQALIIDGVTRQDLDLKLDFGLVRGGTTRTLTYQIANLGVAGASTDLRGAIQTRFGTEGISDARLTGSGVTAQNFGPLAGGSSTGTYAVTFGGAGRRLDDQSIRILNNFNDVKDQIVTFTGSTTALAVGDAAAVPSGGTPVDLGRFRVGVSAPSRSFDVTNTTTGAGAERLGIGSVTTSGNFTVSGIASALTAPGATLSAGFTLGVSGGVAGVNAGLASLQYVSNGQLLDPTFTNVASNLQDIAVTATGYALANPNALGSTLSFGTVVKGSVQSRALTISNDPRTGVPLGFQEGLAASFGGVTGADAAKFTVGGALANLAAGGVDSTALSVSLDTSAVGSFSASVPVLFKSNGAGTSGFGLLDLPTQTLGLSAGVIEATIVNPASATILNAQPLSVAARRVGDAAAFATLQIRNTAEPIAETLSASFGGAAAGVVTSGTTISGLGAQTTDAITMRVGVDTASAGVKSGMATIDFKGDISTTLASQSVEVTGKVYQRAEVNSLAPATLDFGVVRSGDAAPTRRLAIGNAAPVTGLNDVLLAGASVRTREFSVAVDPVLERTGLRAGELVADGFTASLSTRGFGLKSGTATIGFESSNPDMASEEIGTRTITLVGQVNEIAAPRFDKVAGDGVFNRFKSGVLQIDFGTIEFGRSIGIELGLANAIEFGDDLAGHFDLGALGAAITASGFDPVLIAAGAAENGLILDFTALSLGSYAGFLTFDWASVYPGLSDLAGSAIRIDVVADVVRTEPPSDVPEPGTLGLLAIAGGWLLLRRRVTRSA